MQQRDVQRCALVVVPPVNIWQLRRIGLCHILGQDVVLRKANTGQQLGRLGSCSRRQYPWQSGMTCAGPQRRTHQARQLFCCLGLLGGRGQQLAQQLRITCLCRVMQGAAGQPQRGGVRLEGRAAAAVAGRQRRRRPMGLQLAGCGDAWCRRVATTTTMQARERRELPPGRREHRSSGPGSRYVAAGGCDRLLLHRRRRSDAAGPAEHTHKEVGPSSTSLSL